MQKPGAFKEKGVKRATKARAKGSIKELEPKARDVVIGGSEDLGLEEAVKRRIEWTPPKDNFTLLTSSDPPEPTVLDLTGHIDRPSSRRRRKGFGDLCQTFEFMDSAQTSGQSTFGVGLGTEPATKKRRLEVTS